MNSNLNCFLFFPYLFSPQKKNKKIKVNRCWASVISSVQFDYKLTHKSEWNAGIPDICCVLYVIVVVWFKDISDGFICVLEQ